MLRKLWTHDLDIYQVQAWKIENHVRWIVTKIGLKFDPAVVLTRGYDKMSSELCTYYGIPLGSVDGIIIDTGHDHRLVTLSPTELIDDFVPLDRDEWRELWLATKALVLEAVNVCGCRVKD